MDNTTAKLLVVDDEPSIRLSLALILSELGFAVRTAKDGFSGLEEMRAALPDVLLSDLNMPGMSGFEFLSVVRRRFPAINVIAMSGAFSGDEVPTGVAADSFYPKGSGVMPLLKMVAPLATQLLTKRNGGVAKTPIWIQRSGGDGSDSCSVTIACPECMRTFTQELLATASQVRQATCVHCLSQLEFALIEPVDESFVPPFQRTRSSTSPSVHRMERATC